MIMTTFVSQRWGCQHQRDGGAGPEHLENQELVQNRKVEIASLI